MVPFLSVLIPCRNEARFLERCLDSVLGSDYPPERMEILLLDGQSMDGSRELAAGYAGRDPRVRLIDNPERITPSALNRGIEQARGSVIARLDAHSTVARDYFTECVAHLLRTGADGAGGTMRTEAQTPGFWARAIVTVLSHPFGVGNSHFRTGTREPKWVDTVFGCCWRREVFDRVGRFHPKLRRSQDMEFSLRLKAAGGRTLLVPRACCTYYARTTFGDFCRHNFMNGQWAILPFVYSEAVPVSARHLVPCAFALALLMGIGLAPWSGWPLAAVGVPYAIANLGASAHAAFGNRTGEAWRLGQTARLPWAFLALHLCYGIGSLWGMVLAAGLVRRRQGRRSEEDLCIPQQF